jgi:hypothetical protein
MTQEEKKLAEIVARIIDNRRDQIKISPMWIATEALKEIDPGNLGSELLRLAGHLQLRQIARAQCRKLFEDTEDDDEPRFNGFDGLQWRYPTARSKGDDQPEYILLEEMTKLDLNYNITRLRSEATTKLAHADLLQAWGAKHFRAHGSA